MRRIWLLMAIGVLALSGAVAVAAPAGFPHFLRMWGSHGSAPGSFNSPDQVAVDARGHVYVADRQNNRVEEFDSRGQLLGVIGHAGSGPGEFSGPRGVAVDRRGDLYVADSANNRIEKFDAAGLLIAVWGRGHGDGSAGTGPGQFNSPRGLATDRAGDLYVADHGNNRIQKLAPSGKVLALWGRGGGDGLAGRGPGQFNLPRGVTVNRLGDVYVADKDNNRIQEFTAHGRFLRKWGRAGGDGSAGKGNGEFHIPYSVAAGPDQLYVADTGNNRVQEFTFSGRFIRRLGRAGGDGTPGSAPGQFSEPSGVAVGCGGDVYVSEEGNSRIQVFGAPGGPPASCQHGQ
jgi:DNA-binding beta-propeller fold protein YncE